MSRPPFTPQEQQEALTAWRKLSPEERAAVTRAVHNLARNIATSIIELRPILERIVDALEVDQEAGQ